MTLQPNTALCLEDRHAAVVNGSIAAAAADDMDFSCAQRKPGSVVDIERARQSGNVCFELPLASTLAPQVCSPQHTTAFWSPC